MPAHVIDIGLPAHDDEKDALAYLAQGLPTGSVVFTNPWLTEPSGAVYEVDAIVAMAHAIYVVEVKGWRGHIVGDTRDWYLPEARRSPLQLAHKTAQVLHNQLARQSYDAGRAWVQELIFLPAAASFQSSNDAVRKRVALRRDIHAVLMDAHRVHDLANRRTDDRLSDEVLGALTKLLGGRPPERPLTHVAGFRIIDRLDANDRYSEVLGEDTTGTRRALRIYRLPWKAGDAELAQLRKRATWEAGVLRSLARAPDDVCLPHVDPPVETDDGLVVPMEHFDGETLPAWLAKQGATLSLRERVGLWVRIANAIAWTHKAGVVHRQLRPDLVLVKGPLDPANPKTPAFRITGFDMAKRQGHRTTIGWSDAAQGRLEGAAPEVVLALSDAVPASDQFSLGLILALLVLRRPLVESTVALVERRHRMPHLHDVDPDVPMRLDDAVAHMLERRASERFASVEEAVAHVLSALSAPGDEPPAAAGLLPGARVGTDYVVEQRLGEGGLSDVYQVKHRLLGERFALKVARPNEVAERAIRTEYHALRATKHGSVVRVHDLTTMVADRITLRLDLVPGTTLSQAVRTASLPAQDGNARRRLGEDLLNVLDEFERIGLMHLDLKPDNLMVTPQGRLVVIDFSLARGAALDGKVDAGPTFGGTMDWRDPSGEPPGHATDRYAAAMCLFWLHAARHPFDGRVPEPGEASDFDAAELEPEGLTRFFQAALHPAPTDRFRSARAMRDAYLTALGASPEINAAAEVVWQPSTPLTEVDLPRRALRALTAAQVRTVGELLSLSDEEIDRVSGLGDRVSARVRAVADLARRARVAPTERTGVGAPPLYRPLASDPTPLVQLSLDQALADALRAAGLRTVGHVAGRTRAELRALGGMGPSMLHRLVAVLVQWQQRSTGMQPPDTLDGLWVRASATLDATRRTVLELAFGFAESPRIQVEIATRLGIDQSAVSQRRQEALDALDRLALAPIAGAIDGYLDLDHGILPLDLVAERLARDFPTAAIEPAALVRLCAELDTRSLRVLDDIGDDARSVLVRPWVDRPLLTTFLDAVSRVVKAWPPDSAAATRNTLKMALPEFEGDPILLAHRLLTHLKTTAGGALFEPPVGLGQALGYVLDATRDGLTYDDLVVEVDRTFAGAGPLVPPLHEIAALLTPGGTWRIDGSAIRRRVVATPEPGRPPSDDPRVLLDVDTVVDPRERVREVLRDVARRGGGFRLVVAPPESHREVATSLILQLQATRVDLTDAWFRRHRSSLSSDARSARLPALRVSAAVRLDQLLTDLVAEHGGPGRVLVVCETGILQTLHGLDQIRLMYDRVRGQRHGFWVMVIPGLILERQPRFNDTAPVWHLPGLVLPLAEALP